MSRTIDRFRCAAGASLAVLLSACSAHAAKAPPPPPAVAVAIERAGSAQTLPLFSGAAGVVAPHIYRLAFEIAGRARAVKRDVGDRVQAGEVVAVLDDADYRAELAAASARAAAAAAAANKVAAGSRPQEKAAAGDGVRSARAQLDQARAEADLARANAERARRLFDQGAISAQANDGAVAADRNARARLAAAQAGLTAAQSQASLIDQGPRGEDRAAAAAEAAAAAAARDLAAITLHKTVLVAPATAYVLQRSVEPGDHVAPGSIVLTLTDAGTPDVVAAVPEVKAAGIRPGLGATIVIGERRIAARVTRVEPQADAATRTVQVRMRAAGGTLRPGAVVIAEIGAQGARGATVPLGALITHADGSTALAVYDVRTHTVAPRAVRVRQTIGERVIVSGVRPGEPIVTAGQYQAQPGVAVSVVSPEK